MFDKLRGNADESPRTSAVRALPKSELSAPVCWMCLLVAVAGFAVPGASFATSRQRAASVELARDLPSGNGLCGRKASSKRYVSTKGSDRNPGSLRRPWRTINLALRRAVPGEAIYVRAGAYPDWATASRSGTAAAPISLRAYTHERATMTGRLKIVGSYFCVTGFRFEGRTTANTAGPMIYPAGAHHIEIFRNRIINAAWSGIYVGDEEDLSSDVNIIGNYISGNGTRDRFDHGVYLGHVDGGLIANNVVVDNRAIGLKIAPEANHVRVTQNTVVSNGTSGIYVGGEASWSSNDDLVVNNIVAFNHEFGIRSFWDQATGSGNRALRNLVFTNGSGAFWFPGGGLVQQQSISANPRFVGSHNYRLQARSPAINRAIPVFSMPFDFLGQKRTGRRPDLGAFER